MTGEPTRTTRSEALKGLTTLALSIAMHVAATPWLRRTIASIVNCGDGMDDESIEDFIGNYTKRFMEFDAGAIAAMYEVPFLAVRDGRPIHLGDHAAILEHLEQLMDTYRKAGAAQATIVALNINRIDKSSAIATVHWHAFSDFGVLLLDFTASYQLLRAKSGGWRALSYTFHQG